MTNNNSTNRKPRAKKWASEVARQQHSNHRRKLAREASDRVKREQQNALNYLNGARHRVREAEQVRRNNMIMNGMKPRLTAVMNSWGLNLPVNLRPESEISGWTDYKTINVSYDERLIRVARDDDGNEIVLTDRELREIAAECRAIFYHEVGHNLFTTTLPMLITLANEQGFSSDFVRVTNPEKVKEAGAEPEWAIDSKFQYAWNMLEDQRMEMALVEESPYLASYLTVMVLRNILTTNYRRSNAPLSWSLITGRGYLPDSVRAQSRAMWEMCAVEEGVSASADEIEQIVSRYCTATDALTMLLAVEDMRAVFDNASAPSTGSGHGPVRRQNRDKDEAKESVQKVGESVQQAKQEQEQSDEDEDGEGDSQSNSSSSENSSQTEDDEERTTGSGNDPADREDTGDAMRQAQDEMQQAREEVLQDLMQDDAVTDDVTAMNEAYNSDDGALQRYTATTDLGDSVLVEKAQSIVDDIVRAFDIATADCAPHWESGQRRGVLEPIRYRTRQPGDLEFFRQWAEDGEPGTDISVSLFLDISGSMQGCGEMLGAAAWSVKTACDRIGIDCDVTTFDHDAARLWSTSDRPGNVPELLSLIGGTEPGRAFQAVLSEERSNKHHIVMIMTDGIWENNSAYQNHRKPNHHAMVFYYENNWGFRNAPMAPDHSLGMRLCVNEAYRISDLLDIPRALESMLVSLV